MYTELLFWTGGALVGLLGLGLAWWGLRYDRAQGRRRCPKCWYDMSGASMIPQSGMRCPECGHIAKSEKKLLKTRRRWKWVAGAIVLVIASPLVSLQPKIKRDGWLSILPTTAIILMPPHFNDVAGYKELCRRMPRRTGKQTAWEIQWPELSRWQWSVLLHHCAQSLRTTHSDVEFSLVDRIICAAANSDAAPTPEIAATLGKSIVDLTPSESDDLMLLVYNSNVIQWLSKDCRLICDAVLERLRTVDKPQEAMVINSIILRSCAPNIALSRALNVITETQDIHRREMLCQEILASPGNYEFTTESVAALALMLGDQSKLVRNCAKGALITASTRNVELVNQVLQKRLEHASSLEADQIRRTLALVDHARQSPKRTEPLDDEQWLSALETIWLIDDEIGQDNLEHFVESAAPERSGPMIASRISQEMELSGFWMALMEALATCDNYYSNRLFFEIMTSNPRFKVQLDPWYEDLVKAPQSKLDHDIRDRLDRVFRPAENVATP